MKNHDWILVVGLLLIGLASLATISRITDFIRWRYILGLYGVGALLMYVGYALNEMPKAPKDIDKEP